MVPRKFFGFRRLEVYGRAASISSCSFTRDPTICWLTRPSHAPDHNVNIVMRRVRLVETDIYMPTPHHPPLAVRRALRKLGGDVRDARKRRGLTAEIVAERAFTTRPTLQRIEAGDGGVGIGIYAAVLNALGLLDPLSQLADPSTDRVGQQLAADALPSRVRSRARKRSATS
jgi:hypothetical protein